MDLLVATNIQWDIDNDSELENLPSNMLIPNNVKKDTESISDYITNETGYCHKGFEIHTATFDKEEKETYKSGGKHYIGSSDIASLTVRTLLCAYVLNFGKDGSYYAYIVNDNVDIPDHYSFVCHGENWLRIYDDAGLVKIFRADEIRIYRAATMGCIIQLRNFNKEN